MKTIALGCALLACAAVAGCGGKAVAASSSSPRPSPTPSPTNAWHQPVSAGGGVSIEVLGWLPYVNAMVDGVGFRPDAGTNFAAIKYRVTNASGSDLTLSFDSQIVDKAGMSWGATWLGGDTAAQPEFKMQTTIVAGESRIGWIGYQIPDTSIAAFNRLHAHVQITPNGDEDYGTVTCRLSEHAAP